MGVVDEPTCIGVLINISTAELELGLNRARSVLQRVRRRSSSTGTGTYTGSGAITNTSTNTPHSKMSPALTSLLIYTIGVKCRGLNKKTTYAPEYIFSLSERSANRMLKGGYGGGSGGGGSGGGGGVGGGGGEGGGMMPDLIKHTRGHLVRIYPKGLRLNSSNFEPHRYWAAGAQLVAMNWQTFGEWAALRLR